MAYDDEWCVLCEEKMKDTTVTVEGKEYEICKDCERLTVN